MRNLLTAPVARYRDVEAGRKLYGTAGDGGCGLFCLPSPTGAFLTIIASTGGGWEHVSVSNPTRYPTWDEMVFVKRAFFNDDEWAVEYHPPATANINVHRYCLHLWRPTSGSPPLPVPPGWMIG